MLNAVFVGVGQAVGKRVLEVPHLAFDVFVFDFQVRNGGVQFRVPVDQTLAAIDQAVLVQADKYFLNRFVETVVHGEAFGFPVNRVAQTAHLAGDGAAGVFFPLPDFPGEFFTTQGVTIRLAFSRQFAFYHHLGRNTGVVGTDLPQGFLAQHALVTSQCVLQRVLEGMAHVQRAGDVRWRDHDGVAFSLKTVLIRLEVAFLFPFFVPGLFDGVGLVGFIHGALRDS